MELLPSSLLDLLVVSVTISTILMVVIQKFKTLPFIKKDWHIWLLNFLFAFIIGIPFSITFYDLSIVDSVWVGVFSFIGAPTLYDALRNQNLINYKPSSLNDNISIPKEDEIKR